jgi:DNA-binding NarL/FixJ family response regulator
LLSESPRRASTHDDGLTERELKVLDLLSRGKSNREIAEILCLSERTVENHARNIYSKLHVHDRTQAILVGQQKGYVRLLASEEHLEGNGYVRLLT